MKKSFNAYIYTNKAEEVYVFPVFVIHPLKCCILITSASAGLMERLRLLNHGKVAKAMFLIAYGKPQP